MKTCLKKLLVVTAVVSSMVVSYLSVSIERAQAAPPQFQVHYIDEDPEWSRRCPSAQGMLVDIDNDGDLDFTVGAGHWNGAKLRDFCWYENRGHSAWVRHAVGQGYSDAGACALDVNDDGQVDLVAGEVLFVNGGKGESWTQHKIGDWGFGCHDMVVVDMNGDGRRDVLVHTYKAGGTFWCELPSDPTGLWVRHRIVAKNYHCGIHPGGVGDLDGDGDPDVVAAGIWCENIDGKGTRWTQHEYPGVGSPRQPFGWGVKTVCRDMDHDGDLDIVQSEADHPNSDLVWLENDGGGSFSKHSIWEDSGHDLHTLWVCDVDLDGDDDIFSGSGVLTRDKAKGDPQYYKVFLFENTASEASKPVGASWIRHELLSGYECHNGVAGDVDGDGDVDFVAKSWDPKRPLPRAYVLLENRVNQGAE